MGSVKRIAGTAFALFLIGLFALRPLLSNPAIAAADVTASAGDWRRLAVYSAPIVLVSVFLFVVGLRSFVRSDDGTPVPTSNNEPERADGKPNILSGQGGTRNRSFEIEEEPPETDVQAHLEYVRTQLERQAESSDRVRTETSDTSNGSHATDASAGPQTADIPEYCPQDYCDAAWAAGGLLGMGGGNYEILPDGDQIRCTECESIVTLA